MVAVFMVVTWMVGLVLGLVALIVLSLGYVADVVRVAAIAVSEPFRRLHIGGTRHA